MRWEFLSKIISIYIHKYIQHVTDGFSIEMDLEFCVIFVHASFSNFARALCRLRYLVVRVDS